MRKNDFVSDKEIAIVYQILSTVFSNFKQQRHSGQLFNIFLHLNLCFANTARMAHQKRCNSQLNALMQGGKTAADEAAMVRAK